MKKKCHYVSPISNKCSCSIIPFDIYHCKDCGKQFCRSHIIVNDELSNILFKNNSSMICYGCLSKIIDEQKAESAFLRVKRAIKELFKKRIYNKDAVLESMGSTKFRSEISDNVLRLANNKDLDNTLLFYSLCDYSSFLSRSYKLQSNLNISLSNILIALEKTIMELRENILDQYFMVIKNIKLDKMEYWISLISQAGSVASLAIIGGTPEMINIVIKQGAGGGASGWIRNGVEKIWPWETRRVIVFKIAIHAIDMFYRNVFVEQNKQPST